MVKRDENLDPRPLWRKHIGGGTLRLTNGYRVKPNEEFRAYEDQIPLAGRDQVKKIKKGTNDDPDPIEDNILTEQEANEKAGIEGDQFYVRHRSGPWYDVVSYGSEQVMNDKALKGSDAQEKCDELNGKND